MRNHEKGRVCIVNMEGQVRKHSGLLKVKYQYTTGQTS